MGVRDILDRTGERGVEGVADVFEHEADGGGLSFPQQPCAVVTPEAERLDGGSYAVGRVRRDARLPVDHARDRLEADAGPRGDVLHGGTATAEHRRPAG